MDGHPIAKALLRRVCALPISLTTEEINAKWTKSTLLACIMNALPGVSDADWRAAMVEAWNAWCVLIPVDWGWATASNVSDVLHYVGAIDEAGKTLAWSELPNGSNSQIKQKYDSGEQWSVVQPTPSNKVDVVTVATHELGHMLGLGHSNTGGAALMDPYYSPSIRVPQALDIQRIQQLYGVRTTPPTQPPPVLPPVEGVPITGDAAMVEVERVVKRWRASV